MTLLDIVFDLKEGFETGLESQRLMTEIRMKKVPIVNVHSPDSEFYVRNKNIKNKIGSFNDTKYTGCCLAHLMSPIKLYKNLKYHLYS